MQSLERIVGVKTRLAKKLDKRDMEMASRIMHLVQDILFPHFVYDDYKWNPVPGGNIERLHKDYGLINKNNGDLSI